MNILIKFIIQLLTMILWYMYLDSTSKITMAPIISLFFIETHKFDACALTIQASIWQIYF